MLAPDPFTLDRRLAEVARAWLGFRRALRAGSARDHRFENQGAFTTLELLRELEQAPAGVFSFAQQRWVFRLGEQHLHRAALVRSADAWWHEPPESQEIPLQRVLLSALADRDRRGSWLRVLREHGAKLAAERLELWQRRAELRERLGAQRFDALWLPGGHALGAAAKLLDATRDAYLEHAPGDLPGLLEVLLASRAGGSFPTHLSTRSLIELVDAVRWFEGLAIDPGKLPPPLAPASFVRGLGALGAAFARAIKSELLAFAATRDAFGLGEHAHAALFAALPLLPAFAQRRLEVPRHALGDFRRRLAHALLANARATALCTLLVQPALQGGQAFRDAFSETFARAFGLECDPRLAGVWLMPRFDQAQRFGALLLAAQRNHDLVQRHDEDWFRNPRAREELRETARLPDASELSQQDVELGLAALERIAG